MAGFLIAANTIYFISEFINKKLEKIGIKLNKEQLDKIKSQISDSDEVNVIINDEQITESGYTEEYIQQIVDELFADLSDDIQQTSDKLINDLPSIIMKVTDNLSVHILLTAKNEFDERNADRVSDYFHFEKNLSESYTDAFKLLDMLIAISTESGSNFNDEERDIAASTDDYIFEVLTRMHARSCQIAYEIFTLLKAGLADGAFARWRSLHEISVIIYFILNHGNDAAERYLLHKEIETYKVAHSYKNTCKQHGSLPLTDIEFEELKENYNYLISRFGRSFGNRYGWAAEFLQKPDPSFFDIEKDTELNHIRPFYKLACDNIHAGSRAIYFKLGLDIDSDDLLLAGPSDLGLTDPGRFTALSLSQITVSVLTYKPTIDRIVESKIISTLSHQVADAFINNEEAIRNS